MTSAERVNIETGISEGDQQDTFQNATLQGSDEIAFSIATFVKVPKDYSEEQVEQFLRDVLTRVTDCAPEISFEVQIGEAME